MCSSVISHAPALVASFSGRGELVTCALSSALVKEFVPQQVEDSSCILDPYTVLVSLASDVASLLPLVSAISGADHVYNDSEIEAIAGPVLVNADVGAPFCSQCYSFSCACDNASSSEGAISAVAALAAEVPTLQFFFGDEFNKTNLRSSVLAYFWSFGGPLENFSNIDEWENRLVLARTMFCLDVDVL